jgi:hypothetical protein
MERALQLGGDLPLTVALTNRCIAGAYVGRAAEARSDAESAIAAGGRYGSYRLAEWPIPTLGFIDLSLGDYAAAMSSFEPLLARLASAPQASEILVAWFVPDAVEAMVRLDRLDEADHFIGLFESNGARLDRAWMLATGGRCRAMLLAAQGDVDAANVVAQQAITEHARLPMPFERTRTQLLLGQLQRRRRQQGGLVDPARVVGGLRKDGGRVVGGAGARRVGPYQGFSQPGDSADAVGTAGGRTGGLGHEEP